MMRTTRHTIPVVLVVSVLVAGGCGGSSKGRAPTTTGPSSSTVTTVAPTTTTTMATTTTTAPALDPSTAVWPTVSSARRFSTPAAAAASFAVGYLGMVAPLVGAFRQGDGASGEVPVRPTLRGPVTTVIVRRLGPGATWWVLGSATPNIRLTEPAALSTISSPVRLQGESTAFEATVNLSIRADDTTRPLAETYTMGGANGTMGPFDATVSYATPAKPDGAVVLYTISSETGHVSEATVVRVHFSGA